MVTVAQHYQNMRLQKRFDRRKIMKNKRKNISKSANFFCYVIYNVYNVFKKKMLAVKIEDGRQPP